ncbi:hypothetical protein CRENBAI_023695 [Crenichthys baileyi]|uniref:Uncharacterized protein n=1 Tax=Crenichthys baileyi TaxID=28760 RepID=A0AAV9RBB3_9TELE
MRNLPTDMEVLPSPLLLEQMEREAAQRQRVQEGCSVPPPQLRCSPPASVPAAKPSSSSRRRNCRCAGVNSRSAGEEVVSLPADVRTAASKTAPSSATAKFPRLAAAPPKPSSARCSEATPEELEERLRFFARQIKSFRRTSLMYSSPELMERIRQMERDYETAVRQFYCRPPSTPGLQGAAGAAAEQPTPGLQGAAAAAAEQPTPGLQGAAAAAAEQPMPGLQPAAAAEQPTPGLQPAAAAEQPTPGLQPAPDSRPDPKSASTSSTRHRGRCKRGASAPGHATEGPADASAPAHATEGPADSSAPAHATDGPADASAPTPSLQGFSEKLTLVLASEPCDEGFEEEEPPDPVFEGFKEQFVLVLASEHLDEGFEEKAPPDPVSGEFKEQFVLVLASEPRDEGSPGSASASEGSPGSASEGSPASASEGSPGIRRRLPELCACSGRPPGRPPELCACSGRPPEHFVLRLQVYWWFLESLEVEREADPLVIRLLSCGTSSQSYTRPDSVSTCDTFLEGGIVQAFAANNLMLSFYR